MRFVPGAFAARASQWGAVLEFGLIVTQFANPRHLPGRQTQSEPSRSYTPPRRSWSRSSP